MHTHSQETIVVTIHPCHTAAILSRETKRALFSHAKPRDGNHGGEAYRGKTKLFWPPCDKGEWMAFGARSLFFFFKSI